ncbi:MAG: hypothetical protein ABI425_00760 [Patescibacteria group bacterium]
MQKRKKSTKKPLIGSQPLVKIDRIESTSMSKSLPISEKKSSRFVRVLHWLDNHILLILSAFLFAFIPLYPKLPLADIIPGYIVRLRLEDLFVAATIVIYGIQILRKKAQWKTPFTWIILAYSIVGILSTISAVYITKTIPLQPLHVGKTLLHYFRYLEYFSLFFVAYSAVKTKKDFTWMLAIFATTVVLISMYGYGQKFFYWPLYSTMNREFSKGQRLYLTEHARVQSTFGGHYDMAGYLAVALPMLLAIFFATKKWRWKVPLFISYTAGLWLLIMSASRASFAGFVVGAMLLIALFVAQQSTWKRKLWWGFSRGSLTAFMILYMFFTFGDSIFERFLQILQPHPALMDTYDSLNESRKSLLQGNFSAIIQKYTPKLPDVKPPENGHAVTAEDQENTHVLVPSDERPTTQQPSDVYVQVPDTVFVTTVSASGVATTSSFTRDRVYSENALKYGLSMAIRLDTLWPQAIRGFQSNPLLGSGYATLTKANVDDFTEAESTDNNFLRTLGETGLLGVITFYGTIVIGMFLSGKILLSSASSFAKAVAIGFVTGSVALLVNAVYIDVYASSKIAFTYWALSGFVISYFARELAEGKMRPQLPGSKVETAVLPKPKQ